jgi:hypothetical protein
MPIFNHDSRYAGNKRDLPRFIEEENDISEDKATLMEELKFEGILDARESRERAEW